MHFDNFFNKEEINGLVDYIIMQSNNRLFIFKRVKFTLC